MSATAKAQFVQVPPLERIRQMFTFVTGQPFEPLVSWSAWKSPTKVDLDWFRAYIRPCHQKIILETVEGAAPCALLRQLLRPYDYYIDTHAGTWTLRHGKLKKCVREEGAKVIDWT